MKTKLTIIILLTSISIFSQKYVDTLYNFKVDTGNIIWQKVFETNKLKQVKEFLKSNEFTNTLTEVNNSFTGRTTNTKKRLVKNTPYYANFGFDGFCTIDFKENKYRVTLKDIVFDGPTITVAGIQKKQNYPLQLQVIKKDKIYNKKKVVKVLTALNTLLLNKFTLQNTKKEDW
jgi:hypothetical protein